MKKRTFLYSCALACVLGLGLCVVSLTACSSGADGGSSEETATTDADTQDDATDQDADASETDVAPAPEPAWVLTKETSTYTYDGDTSTYTITREIDEHGNRLRVSMDDGTGADPSVTAYEWDEDGFITGYTSGEESVTVTAEKDDQGREVKSTYSDGSVVETTYDENGAISKRVYTGTSQTMDGDGNWVDAGTYVRTVNYDGDGFVLSGTYDSDSYSSQYEKSYERDADGRVTSVTTAEGPAGEEPTIRTVAVEYDENGNIVRATETTEGYSMVNEYEYTLVNEPSLGASLESHLKPL